MDQHGSGTSSGGTRLIRSSSVADSTRASSGSGRWKPTSRQKEILESLYPNEARPPSLERILEITELLKPYGRVEGKNVHYWFQNHTNREKRKSDQAEPRRSKWPTLKLPSFLRSKTSTAERNPQQEEEEEVDSAQQRRNSSVEYMQLERNFSRDMRRNSSVDDEIELFPLRPNTEERRGFFGRKKK